MFTLSRLVCPSTSTSPARSKLPLAVIFPATVVTPEILTLSKFVCLSTFRSPATDKSLWNVLTPTKVETPETLTLSKLVCPSTSISPARSIFELAIISAEKVAIPATTFNPPASILIPLAFTSIPSLAVINPTESTFLTSS